jgi:hypothetical protein
MIKQAYLLPPLDRLLQYVHVVWQVQLTLTQPFVYSKVDQDTNIIGKRVEQCDVGNVYPLRVIVRKEWSLIGWLSSGCETSEAR